MGLSNPERGKTSLEVGGPRAWVLMGWLSQQRWEFGLGAPPWGPACLAPPLACPGRGCLPFSAWESHPEPQNPHILPPPAL